MYLYFCSLINTRSCSNIYNQEAVIIADKENQETVIY